MHRLRVYLGQDYSCRELYVKRHRCARVSHVSREHKGGHRGGVSKARAVGNTVQGARVQVNAKTLLLF